MCITYPQAQQNNQGLRLHELINLGIWLDPSYMCVYMWMNMMSDAVGVIGCFSRQSTNAAEHHIMCANNPAAPDRLSGPGGTWHTICFKIPLVLQIGGRYLSLTAIFIMFRWWTIFIRELEFENFLYLKSGGEFMENSAKIMKNSGLTKWTQNLR